MSVKLFHAFELHLDPTDTVPAWVGRARALLEPLADTTLRRWQVREVIRTHDLSLIYDQAVAPGKLLARVREDGHDALLQAHKGYREPSVDVGVSVLIITDPTDGRFYGLYFVENSTMRQALMAMPEVIHAPYQDQTDDIPEGLDEARWAARRALWERLVPRGPVGDAGVTYELVPTPNALPTLTLTDVTDHWVPDERRVQRVMANAVGQEMALALQAGGESLSQGRHMRLAVESFEPDHPLKAILVRRVTALLSDHPLDPIQLLDGGDRPR